MIYTSGCIGLDPKTGAIVSDDVSAQVTQSIENLKAVLEDNDSSLKNITRWTLFLIDMKDFEVVNKIYSSYFDSHPPARTTVAVHQLPKGAKFEIQADATVKNYE